LEDRVKTAMRGAGIAAFVLAGWLTVGAQAANEGRKAIPPQSKDNPLHELISGYYYNGLALRSLQDDDFDNPGYVWATQGEKLWNQPDGAAKKSCASCHSTEAMRGKSASYPKYYEPAKRVVTLEQRINICREDKMNATQLAYESDALLSVTTYIRLQSRHLPVNVSIDGAAAQAFALGKRIYSARTGQYGMSCAQCHNERYGASLRGEIVSQGHPNGYPAYRMSAKKLTSLHDRLRECFQLMRAEPYDSGAAELSALELYLNWRANGLPVEAPAVRR
jgi:sulfur-oxidizing protein SoxA